MGQIVELINQPPNYGRSLDGTLARIVWTPKFGAHSVRYDWIERVVHVEVYRRHKRTGRPLKLKSWSMHEDQLQLVEEPNADQIELLALVEPMRVEQRERRERLRRERIAWEERVLDMANAEPSSDSEALGLAAAAITKLHSGLRAVPPEGVTTEDIDRFFLLYASGLKVELATSIELLLVASEAPSPIAKIQCSEEGVLAIQRKIDDSFEFEIDIGTKGVVTTVYVQPDVDGITISLGPPEHHLHKLTSLEAPDLLLGIVEVFPQLTGGSVKAWYSS